ncbi:MAG: two-component system sensor histidine kinase NtrB [Kofleriaceae bacterium]
MVILSVLVAALAALAVLGIRVLARDRQALYERYAEERLHLLEEAARVLEHDVQEVGEDLDLASKLLEFVDSPEVAERELHAIATIKREYLVVEARRDDGTTSRVATLDAPAGITELVGAQLSDAIERAAQAPGELIVSGPIVVGNGPAAWYRAFARRPIGSAHVIGVAVDLALLLDRLNLLRTPDSRFSIVGSDGRSTLRSDELSPAMRGLVDASRRERTAIEIVEPAVAAANGLPHDTAVAVAVTVQIDPSGAPWTFVRISSATSLHTQERTLVRRLVVGGALALAMLLASAGYVLFNTRRAAALRERLRHADKLAHLTEKAEKILDHIPSGVLALSDELRITATNRWLAARLDRSVIGEPLATAFAGAPVDDVAKLTALVGRARHDGAARSLHRQRLALFGADALVNLHAIPLARSVADVSVLVVVEDLTPLRRIEERLLHSEKLVTAGQLAAGIAHEIGTPLSIARGRAELALSRGGGEHAQAPGQLVIIDQIDRVTRLIHQLLDYVRPSSADVRAVDVSATCERVKELLGMQATKRGVALDVEIPERVPPVRADADQLQQVLVNLVINAIDACGKGGHVALRATPRDGAVQLEVVDDGPGIPPELSSHVFDPFFTTKKRGQGTGLGLWVVAQLVRAHDGDVEVASEPGSGTTVRISWPAAPAGELAS